MLNEKLTDEQAQQIRTIFATKRLAPRIKTLQDRKYALQKMIANREEQLREVEEKLQAIADEYKFDLDFRPTYQGVAKMFNISVAYVWQIAKGNRRKENSDGRASTAE